MPRSPIFFSTPQLRQISFLKKRVYQGYVFQVGKKCSEIRFIVCPKHSTYIYNKLNLFHPEFSERKTYTNPLPQKNKRVNISTPPTFILCSRQKNLAVVSGGFPLLGIVLKLPGKRTLFRFLKLFAFPGICGNCSRSDGKIDNYKNNIYYREFLFLEM